MKPITGNIAIEGKNIVKDFKIGETTTRVLKNVSLKVLKGEFVSIIGQSGSDGKKFKDYRKQLDNILEIVGLSDRRKHTPRELSGGQQQRAAIARALISDPEILFADEPTGNLDSKTGAEIMKLLQSINKNSGQTIIMVTHSPEAAKNGNRIITVKDGMIE